MKYLEEPPVINGEVVSLGSQDIISEVNQIIMPSLFDAIVLWFTTKVVRDMNY